MSFANSMYSVDNLVHSFSVDLNSRLADNLSNQLLATYSKLDDVRGTTSEPFPFIDILKDDQAYMSLGYELFTWNNGVHNDALNIKDEVESVLFTGKGSALSMASASVMTQLVSGKTKDGMGTQSFYPDYQTRFFN
jgi:hypothetical protein